MWRFLCEVCVSVVCCQWELSIHAQAARERCPPSVVLKCAHHRSAFCFTRLLVTEAEMVQLCDCSTGMQQGPAINDVRAHTHEKKHTTDYFKKFRKCRYYTRHLSPWQYLCKIKVRENVNFIFVFFLLLL